MKIEGNGHSALTFGFDGGRSCSLLTLGRIGAQRAHVLAMQTSYWLGLTANRNANKVCSSMCVMRACDCAQE